ncbi:hypothetical protein IAT40_006536 [Kwoniella sp. CBS 6097]
MGKFSKTYPRTADGHTRAKGEEVARLIVMEAHNLRLATERYRSSVNTASAAYSDLQPGPSPTDLHRPDPHAEDAPNGDTRPETPVHGMPARLQPPIRTRLRDALIKQPVTFELGSPAPSNIGPPSTPAQADSDGDSHRSPRSEPRSDVTLHSEVELTGWNDARRNADIDDRMKRNLSLFI